MTASVQIARPAKAPSTTIASPNAAFARFKAWVSVSFWRFQSAQMESVLAQFSDTQLEQIGITRSEIPGYAESLTKAK